MQLNEISSFYLHLQELYKHLPKQRRLPEPLKEKAISLLRMNANKKLVQKQLIEDSGKIILLKDLSNLKASIKLNQPRNDLDATVRLLKETYSE